MYTQIDRGFFGGWEIMFPGKTSKTDHSKTNLAEEGNGGSL